VVKKRRRRSNSIAVPAPPTESESIRVSKISNGYLISKSGTKRGKYFEHTEYSVGRPVIAAAGVPEKAAAKSPGKPNARKTVAHREVGYLRGS
jgi:hypothetical protein